LGLYKEIRAFNAVQPFAGCSAGRASQPLAQGVAEIDFGLGLPETRNKEQLVRYPPLLTSPARGEEE